MKTIREFDVTGKKVLVRCDFNVPLDDRGNIVNDFRIQQVLGTIRYLVEKKAKIILMSHLGDPEGRLVLHLRLENVRERLEKLLGQPVLMAPDCIGPETESMAYFLESSQVMLLENLRFHGEEQKNDGSFAKALANLGELYFNEAFSVCHRAHASVVGIPQYLPHGAGLLLEREMVILDEILQNPQRPMVAVVGGAKVKTKAKFIEKISGVADTVIVSGLIKKEMQENSIQFKHAEKIIGPESGLEKSDIDERSIRLFRREIAKARTVLWNGPFGRFEEEPYKHGTLAIANAIIESGAFSVVGGGETVEFLEKENLLARFSHVSTGGGAMLNYLSGDELPGIKALEI